MSANLRPFRSLALALLLAQVAACAGGVDHAALRVEVGSKPVVLLSTAWCGYCRKLRADLNNWDVPYDEIDVEQSDAGQRAYELVGGHGVPILLVGDQVVHGYSPKRARELIGEAGIDMSSVD